MNILSKYKIYLENTAWDFEIRGKEVGKTITTNNRTLNTFLMDWNAQTIDEDLLPDIQTAQIDPNAEVENGSETIYISIYHNTVKFYQISDKDPDKILEDYLVYELPTQDFKEIVLLWRDFLMTSPLNGSKL